MDELSYNKSHAADPTASKAIGAADKPTKQMQEFIKFIRCIAEWNGWEISNRIHIKDKKTGIIYK